MFTPCCDKIIVIKKIITEKLSQVCDNLKFIYFFITTSFVKKKWQMKSVHVLILFTL